MNAHENYLAKRELIRIEIKILQRKLDAMDIDEEKDRGNWGYSGNCDYILETTMNLNYGFMEKY
jgi:hypothetical protein